MSKPAQPRLLLIDNYDSFTYNLVQAFLVLGAEVRVVRNDEITVERGAGGSTLTHLCISPGPGTPRDAGVSMDMIRAFAGRLPIFGVCLGHQSIVEVFGGDVVRAPRLMHGKTSHGRSTMAGRCSQGLPQPCEVGRYHSLIAAARDHAGRSSRSAPPPRRARSWRVRHRRFAIEGVQFHPESVLTPQGPQLMGNFLRLTAAVRAS